jgi:hypothetical protein
MSALLALLVLGGAAWFVVSLAGGRGPGRREPVDSVHEFARAMSALDPTTPPRPVRTRPAVRR